MPMTTVYGPINPIVRDSTGYEYRAMPGRDWARGASIDVDVAAVAWALSSEAPNVERYPRYSRAIGHAILNAANAVKLTPHERVTMEGLKVAGRPARAAGHYGRQAGRWCASLNWPLAAHLDESQRVHSRTEPDHPGQLWVDCRVMDRGLQNGKPLQYDAVGIVRRRFLQRWAWVGPIYGIDPYVLFLFRPRVATDVVTEGLDVVEEGRRRWGVKR